MTTHKGSKAPTQAVERYDRVLEDICEYVYDYIPEGSNVRERARTALLDALGCAIETTHVSTECQSLLGPVVAGTRVPHGFKLPGTPHQLDPVKGSFDMGTLIRYLDHNDAVGGAEWGHPSDNLGALISVADWLSRENSAQNAGNGVHSQRALPPLTMRTLLDALIKAYEVQGCLQELNSFNAVGLDHTILVKVASTAVVSWLMGLTHAEALTAISQAFQDGHPLRTFRQAPNAGPRKGWAAGDACMRAVHLALLTRAGQTGAPTVLSDPRWGFNATLFRWGELKLQRPYGTHVIQKVGFKVLPNAGRGTSCVDLRRRVPIYSNLETTYTASEVS